jgi:hypothetical protein
MINLNMKTFAFRWQDAMTVKDWAMLAILIVVSGGLWLWVLSEYQKPFVNPDWVSSHVNTQTETTPTSQANPA